MIISAAIYTLIYLAFAIDLIIPLAPFRWMHQTSFILGSVYIIVLGFFGHRQGNIFSERNIGIELQEPGPSSEINYSLTRKENDFILFLLKYMNKTNIRGAQRIAQSIHKVYELNRLEIRSDFCIFEFRLSLLQIYLYFYLLL